MANSRKDSKGRVLRKGESQRTDGLYQYRYNDCKKKRQTVYARKLPHISAHTFRHTFCSNCVNAGMSLKTVQYLMGHSDASVTLDVYSDVNMDQIAEEMQNFKSHIF